MNRHLLPEEIDLLVDGEAGFGVAPLRAHVRDCAECAFELEAARALATELDLLPHHAPAPLFADRVMAQVQVFEPWHVALGDAVRRLVPQSPSARVLAAAGGLTFATLVSVATLWVIARVDLLALVTGAALDRTQAASRDLGGALLRALLGQDAASGAGGLVAVAVVAFAVTLVAATAGLRAAAVTAGRRRAE